MRYVPALVISLLLLAAPARAQAPSTATPQTPSPSVQTPPPSVQAPRTTTPVATTQAPRPPGLPATAVNVRLDLKITDTASGGRAGATAPATKTVSLLVLSGNSGMIRTQSVVDRSSVYLNVDAAAQVYEGGRVTVRLTFEYTPAPPAGDAVATSTAVASLHESVNVLLRDGQTLLLSQSADPATDRSVTVELTATILK